MQELLADRYENARTLSPMGGTAVEYEAESGLFYFLLADGLYTLDRAGKWTRVLFEGSPLFAASLESSHRTTWVGSLNQGVIGFREGKPAYHYQKGYSLEENEIRGLEITSHFIWVLTENYLHRIDLKTRTVAVFDEGVGIRVMDINAMATLNNRLYLATNQGLIRIPENLKNTHAYRPSLRLNSIEVNDRTFPPPDRLELPYDEASLRLNLSSVAFRSRGKYAYAYKVAGLDSSFTRIPASNGFIQLSHLSPGDFTLLVKAVPERGPESEVMAIPVRVLPPYWQNWWFFPGLLILLSAVVALLAVWRVRIIRRRIEYQNQLIQSQLTAIKSQMNPHFMFNTLNSLQDLIVNNDIKASNYYLSKFSNLLRKVLETSSQTEISLKTEIDLLETYLQLEKLRFGEEFNFRIDLDAEIDPEEVYLHPMLLQPFVENAIKHGLMHIKGARELLIRFQSQDGVLCIIDDNGVGREKAAYFKRRDQPQHLSFATEASQKRVELINKMNRNQISFRIIDKPEGTGTRVEIHIPPPS